MVMARRILRQAAAPSRHGGAQRRDQRRTEDLPEVGMREIDECIVVDLEHMLLAVPPEADRTLLTAVRRAVDAGADGSGKPA